MGPLLADRNSPRGHGCRLGRGEGRRAERGPWTSGPLLPVASLCLWGLLRHDHVYTHPADVTVLLHTPSLWLGGSGKDNTQFMTGSSGCMVTCWPCQVFGFCEGLTANQKLFLRRNSYPQRMAGLCSKILRPYAVIHLEGCQRLQTASLSAADTSGTVGSAGS